MTSADSKQARFAEAAGEHEARVEAWGRGMARIVDECGPATAQLLGHAAEEGLALMRARPSSAEFVLLGRVHAQNVKLLRELEARPTTADGELVARWVSRREDAPHHMLAVRVASWALRHACSV